MSHEPEHPERDSNDGLRRRDFLALAPAAAAAAATVATVGGLPRAAFADDSPLDCDLVKGEELSVGYIEGSEAWIEAPDLPWQGAHVDHLTSYEIEVVPANRLQGASELASRAIELTVHGLVPGLPAPGTASWANAYLFASLPAPSDLPFGPDPVPFLAWSARADADPRQAAKVRPRIETGSDGSLYVGLEIRTPAIKRRGGSTVELRSADFTVDSFGNRPKLRQGVYLLAFAPGLWSRSWRGSIADLASEPGLESVAIGVLALD